MKGWRKQCEERAEWKRITEKAKNPQGVVMPVKEEEVLVVCSAKTSDYTALNRTKDEIKQLIRKV